MAMAATSRGVATPFKTKARRADALPVSGFVELRWRKRRLLGGDARWSVKCCCPDSVVPIRGSSGSGKSADNCEEWRFDPLKINRVRVHASTAMPFASPQSRFVSKPEKFFSRCTPRNSGPQSRDTPPKRDTGIANEKDWGIDLLNENINESGVNEDGSTWYRESGEDLGENGYRCRWARMGGRNHDSTSEWKETWWEKSDWSGYKELGVEKSGENAEGDSWWETWREVLHQDEWSNLARIERSAQKQAKSGTENAGWYENWWEKYDAKGWTEKGAHKYGRLNEQSWWEKWGEHYDGRGSVLKWTDKWAETALGTKWGDKWEEKFFAGIGSRQGETWHVSPIGDRWSRTWGEEHFGNGKVHKYGKSTTGESWDIVVDEETYYEAEPHYGWADVVGDSNQLLSIQPRERPPGVYPNMDFGPTAPPPSSSQPSDELPPSSSQPNDELPPSSP
nr:inactive purple acid phosphatase-like protein [Ipomoea batatas]GMD43608.1 inactive purple acid phosphatase-like protein [Ipomoea batatas]GME19351.1 inactive purple acid phosphatase-like protein [Ipomoea batatas]